LGEGDVVDVVGAIFVVVEIVGGLGFLALGFGKNGKRILHRGTEDTEKIDREE